MSEVTFAIRREISEKTSNSVHMGYLEWIGENTINDMVFPTDYKIHAKAAQPGDTHKWAFDATVTFFSKTKKPWDEDTIDKIRNLLMERLNKQCHAPKFSKYPFVLIDDEGKPIPPEEIEGASDIIPFEKACLWEEFAFDDTFIDMDDEQLESSEAFSGIYERGPHIRLMLGAIQKAIETNGRIRNHVLLYGDPGAAKTGVIDTVKTILPNNAYITLNIDSCSRAGFQKLILKEMRIKGVPPIIFLEEIEKIDSDAVLRPFLSLMDTRASMQKINNRESGSFSGRILFIATANNKKHLDMMMGGYKDEDGEIQPGAISSRFVHQLYTERPSWATMKKIVMREFLNDPIDLPAPWTPDAYIGRILDLADELDITDPRKVISFLDGGLRILDGKYQEDMLSVRKPQREQAYP